MTPELADKLNEIVIGLVFLISFFFTLTFLAIGRVKDVLEDKIDKLYTLIKDKR